MVFPIENATTESIATLTCPPNATLILCYCADRINYPYVPPRVLPFFLTLPTLPLPLCTNPDVLPFPFLFTWSLSPSRLAFLTYPSHPLPWPAALPFSLSPSSFVLLSLYSLFASTYSYMFWYRTRAVTEYGTFEGWMGHLNAKSIAISSPIIQRAMLRTESLALFAMTPLVLLLYFFFPPPFAPSQT